MDIVFRNILPTESKDYRRIRLESLQKFPDSFSANYLEAYKTEVLVLENEIVNQTFEKFVCGGFSGSELIGICAFVKNEIHMGTINQLYVRESFQGGNVGLRLVEEVIKTAGVRYNSIEIYLEVSTDNFKAFNLYRKIGFEVYQEKDKLLLMKYYSKK